MNAVHSNTVAMAWALPPSPPSPHYGGFGCSPLHEEDARHFCAVCRSHVIKEPEVTECCRNYFCASCLDRCRGVSTYCPLCRAPPPGFASKRDEALERELLRMAVVCQNAELGCTWTGTLQQHGDHVTRECPHGLTECPLGCTEILYRRDVGGHVEERCSLRRVRCRHCKVEGTHDFIVHSHEKLCIKSPVACPNGCGGAAEAGAEAKAGEQLPPPLLLRENLPAHLEACPLGEVSCRFASVGCDAVVARREMSSHMEMSRDDHLLHVLDKMVAMQSALSSQQEEMTSLRSELRTLRRECERLRLSSSPSSSSKPAVVPVVSVVRSLEQRAEVSRGEPFLPNMVLKMDHFDQQKESGGCWLSSAFYTCPAGHKLRLGVFPRGRGEGEGTHLAVGVYVVPGEFDDNIIWPLRQDLTVVLRNQLSHEGGHLQADCSFTERRPGHRVIPGRDPPKPELGRGHSSGTNWFILLSRLGHSRQRNTQYLRNNCLYFEVY